MCVIVHRKLGADDTKQLGFKLAFGDKADPPNYVGFRRDAVELHMQFQFDHEMGTIRLRFLVDDPDALFSEYRQRGVECNPNSVHDTSWGTREFALYDLDRNALTFYRDLTSGRTFSISARLATSGKSFTAGFGIDWKIRLTHPNR